MRRRRLLRAVARILENGIVIGLGLTIALSSLVVSMVALDRTADKTRADAKADAAANALRTAELAETFCGLMEPIGFPPGAVPEPATEFGKIIKRQAQRTVRLLGCTPDRTDFR